MPNTDLAERLSSAGIACLPDNCPEHGLPVAGGNFHSDLVSLACARPASEKILIEIFFNLAFYLAKMAEMSVAHCSLTMENILLNRNLNPILSNFHSCIEPAGQPHLVGDLNAVGKIMHELANPPYFSRQKNSNWPAGITQSMELINLRNSISSLAQQAAEAKTASAGRLMSSLVHIYPRLIHHNPIYPTPPAVALNSF